MEPKTAVPYDWLKTLAPALHQLDHIPLFGECPAFPWEEFAQKIAKTFGIDGIQVAGGEIHWREADDLYSDLGDNPFIQSISIATFEGHPHFVMDKEELQTLLSALITKEIPTEPLLFDPELDEAFHRFFALEVIHTISLIAFDKELSIHLHKEESTLHEPSLGINLTFTLLGRSFSARLLLPPSFMNSWRSHYAEKKLQLPLSTALLGKIETSVHVEIGRVELSQELLKSLKPGDLVVLDECTFDPQSQKGQAALSIQGVTRCKGTIEKGNITLTEVPLTLKKI